MRRDPKIEVRVRPVKDQNGLLVEFFGEGFRFIQTVPIHEDGIPLLGRMFNQVILEHGGEFTEGQISDLQKNMLSQFRDMCSPVTMTEEEK